MKVNAVGAAECEPPAQLFGAPLGPSQMGLDLEQTDPRLFGKAIEVIIPKISRNGTMDNDNERESVPISKTNTIKELLSSKPARASGTRQARGANKALPSCRNNLAFQDRIGKDQCSCLGKPSHDGIVVCSGQVGTLELSEMLGDNHVDIIGMSSSRRCRHNQMEVHIALER